MIQERLEARLIDIEAQMKRVKEQAQETVEALQRQKQALLDIKRLISPELLEALAKIQATGLLTTL